MALIDDQDSVEFALKRSLLAKSKRAIIVKGPAGVMEYRCVECPIGFNDKSDMEQHLAVHNKEYRFLCGVCGTALKRKEHLDRHTLEHQEVRPHICPDCGKGFKRKEHLNIHRTIHSGEKNHTCPLCDKSFYRKDHMQKHLQTHNKMFIEQNIYPVSDQELMGIKQEVMDEDQVDEGGLSNDMILEIHDAIALSKQAAEEAERPHMCPVCNKRFKRKDHLKLHSVSHLARDKVCQDCGKAFRTEEQLSNHTLLHVKTAALPSADEHYVMDDEYTTEEDPLLVPRLSMDEGQACWTDEAGDRPYSCQVCSRRFKRKQHLKVHSNVHSKQHPPTIWCSICSEGFFTNNQFESHECMGADSDGPPRNNQENSLPAGDVVEIMNVPIVTEEPDRPGLPVPRRVFVCRFCSKPFKRKDHFRIHQHVHTGLKSFFCEDCGKGFYRKDHLQKHALVHNKTKPKPRIVPRKPKKEMPDLFPIHMLNKKTDARVQPEITITAPSNTKLRVPLQIKVPYQVVMSLGNGEQRAVTVDPRRDQLLS